MTTKNFVVKGGLTTGNIVLDAASGNITGVGNANLGNLTTSNYFAGTLTTAAQPNITSVGTLSNLTSNGTINFTSASNVSLGAVGNLKITGGTANYVLQTDGAGNLTWVAQSGGGSGNAAGSNTQVQFNDGNSFAGNAGLTFNKIETSLSKREE